MRIAASGQLRFPVSTGRKYRFGLQPAQRCRYLQTNRCAMQFSNARHDREAQSVTFAAAAALLKPAKARHCFIALIFGNARTAVADAQTGRADRRLQDDEDPAAVSTVTNLDGNCSRNGQVR